MKKILKTLLIPYIAVLAVGGAIIMDNMPVENVKIDKSESVVENKEEKPIVDVAPEGEIKEVAQVVEDTQAPDVAPAPRVVEKLTKEQVISRVNNHLLSYGNDKILKQMGLTYQSIYNPVWDRYEQGLVADDAIETEAEACKAKVVIQAEDIPREKRMSTKYSC